VETVFLLDKGNERIENWIANLDNLVMETDGEDTNLVDGVIEAAGLFNVDRIARLISADLVKLLPNANYH
jgi:hypothetical protein